jgi:hypothetical protein
MIQFCTFIRYNFMLVQLAEVIQGITQESVICMFRVVAYQPHSITAPLVLSPNLIKLRKESRQLIVTIAIRNLASFMTRTKSIKKLSYSKK